MVTYNAEQAGKIIGIQSKTVSQRATYLGLKKRGVYWYFTLEQIELIKSYVPKRFINTKFSFTPDGEYLIINSKLNTEEL